MEILRKGHLKRKMRSLAVIKNKYNRKYGVEYKRQNTIANVDSRESDRQTNRANEKNQYHVILITVIIFTKGNEPLSMIGKWMSFTKKLSSDLDSAIHKLYINGF